MPKERTEQEKKEWDAYIAKRDAEHKLAVLNVELHVHKRYAQYVEKCIKANETPMTYFYWESSDRTLDSQKRWLFAGGMHETTTKEMEANVAKLKILLHEVA